MRATGLTAALRAALRFLLAAALLAGALGGIAWAREAREAAAAPEYIAVAELPPEARATLALIRQGGPFPYDRDGVVFGNYEKRLPPRPRGYYREYTVPTPGSRNRGTRRIVSGQGSEHYYTADHYQSFSRIRE